MTRVLARKRMQHVLTDCYANDPHIPFPKFLSFCMGWAATHGSILILHMPEKGFREWELEAIERVLESLRQKGLRSVTLSELAAAAGKN